MPPKTSVGPNYDGDDYDEYSDYDYDDGYDDGNVVEDGYTEGAAEFEGFGYGDADSNIDDELYIAQRVAISRALAQEAAALGQGGVAIAKGGAALEEDVYVDIVGLDSDAEADTEAAGHFNVEEIVNDYEKERNDVMTENLPPLATEVAASEKAIRAVRRSTRLGIQETDKSAAVPQPVRRSSRHKLLEMSKASNDSSATDSIVEAVVPDEAATDAIASKKRKGRGPANQTPKWQKEKLQVQVNSENKLCGGEYSQLITQLGVLTKNGKKFPLDVKWKQIKKKEINKLWRKVLKWSTVPESWYPEFVEKLSNLWRNWRGRLKKENFDARCTLEENLAKRPRGVEERQWRKLVIKWSTEEDQKKADINRNNRNSQNSVHSMGKVPKAVLVEKRAQEGKPVDELSIYIAARERSKDRTTKHLLDEIKKAIRELPEQQRNDPNCRKKIYNDLVVAPGHAKISKGKKRTAKGDLVDAVRADVTQSSETGLLSQLQAEREKRIQLEAEIERRVEEGIAKRMREGQLKLMEK